MFSRINKSTDCSTQEELNLPRFYSGLAIRTEPKGSSNKGNSNRGNWKYGSITIIGITAFCLLNKNEDKNPQKRDHNSDFKKIAVSVFPIIGDGAGSGFYYDEKGHIVTCAHVVSEGSLWYCSSLSSSGIYTLKAIDDKTDIAVLNPICRTKQTGSLELFNCARSKHMFSLLKPTELSAFDYDSGEFISSSQRFGGLNITHFDRGASVFTCRAKSGFSGGIITSNNQFEGMVAAVSHKSSPFSIEYYVPARTVDYCTESLIEYGGVFHYDLDIDVEEVNGEIKVNSSSNAKILPADIILSVNDFKVVSIKEFSNALCLMEQTINNNLSIQLTICIFRNGMKQQISFAANAKSYCKPFKYGRF